METHRNQAGNASRRLARVQSYIEHQTKLEQLASLLFPTAEARLHGFHYVKNHGLLSVLQNGIVIGCWRCSHGGYSFKFRDELKICHTTHSARNAAEFMCGLVADARSKSEYA